MSAVAQPRFARVAAAIGDPTRAVMLSRLLDGRHYTATELADEAGVSAPTASQHLKLLVDERLLRVRAQGRHRYFALADGNVAQALEALLRVADGALPEATRWKAPSMRGLRYARTCYGHLAGSLGVRLCESFVRRGWVDAADDDGRAFTLTPEGVAGLAPPRTPAARAGEPRGEARALRLRRLVGAARAFRRTARRRDARRVHRAWLARARPRLASSRRDEGR